MVGGHIERQNRLSPEELRRAIALKEQANQRVPKINPNSIEREKTERENSKAYRKHSESTASHKRLNNTYIPLASRWFLHNHIIIVLFIIPITAKGRSKLRCLTQRHTN